MKSGQTSRRRALDQETEMLERRQERKTCQFGVAVVTACGFLLLFAILKNAVDNHHRENLWAHDRVDISDSVEKLTGAHVGYDFRNIDRLSETITRNQGTQNPIATANANVENLEVPGISWIEKLMTLDEKIFLVHGSMMGCNYTGRTRAVPRLGIPELRENDGPQGFRGGPPGHSTAYPSALNMGATFSTELTFRWGREMAKEFQEKGANMVLGPGLNVMRIPENGRTFEYLSGEDPKLGAALSAASIKGLQSVKGIIATAKHFALNNQEANRFGVNVEIEDVPLHEIYFPPFKAAVDAGVLSIMCAYNLVRGLHACEQGMLLSKTLREDWKFEGFVVSDWLATHSTNRSMEAGLDQEMPLGIHYGMHLKKRVLADPDADAQLSRQVTHVLNAMNGAGLWPTLNPPMCSIDADVTSDERRILAADLAAAGMVLLKNKDKTLPLRAGDAKLKRVALIGSAANDPKVIVGGGSGFVDAGPHSVTALQGLQVALQANYLDVELVFNDGSNLTEAVKLVEEVSLAIVVVSASSSEGFDRSSLEVDVTSERLATAVQDAAVGSHIRSVLVIIAPGPMILPMVDDADAALVSFMPGQAFGTALAKILLGDAVPAGRLPVTFPKRGSEITFTPEQYPGGNYSEGLLVGYRWFDHHSTKVAFPFGHGLSYTEFAYSNATIQALSDNMWQLDITLQNIGDVCADEVVQVYLARGSNCSNVSAVRNGVTRPPKKLVKFSRVHVPRQTSRLLSLQISFEDVAEWSPSGWELGSLLTCPHEWLIGASSQDVRARLPFASTVSSL